MTMVGGATVGYCATGRLVIAVVPSTRMNNAITHANTGRSMKNLDMVEPHPSQGFEGADAEAVGDAGAEAAMAAGAPGGVQGTGLTGAPGRIFWKPSTITISPAFSPSRITHWPACWPPIF